MNRLPGFPEWEGIAAVCGEPLCRHCTFRIGGNADVALFPATVEELIRALKKYDSDDIFVIGGAAIYRLLLPYCDTVYVTMVDYAYQADTWFTNLDLMPEWEMTEESEEQTCFDITFTFRTYRRRYHASLPE